ncbi:hypothetical protein BC827DRAFT_1153580 [Russula dissimulans]|nr:hypothetical protein BC827DRAFT_1153580 [Russula dissimulans]
MPPTAPPLNPALLTLYTPRVSIMQFLDFPEEILLSILELTIRPVDPRVCLPDSTSLLTCRTFHRIGLPILYRAVLIKSASNATLVYHTLVEQPSLVRHVCHLYSRVSTFGLLLVLRAIGHAGGSLQTLDFEVSIPWMSGRLDGDKEEPLAAVQVRHLVVRPGAIMFPRYDISEVATAFAKGIECWPNLEVVEIEPRMLLASIPRQPPSRLALALSRSPSLRVLRTTLPPAWDPFLLVVSENPSLRHIVLTKPRLTSGSDRISSIEVDVSAASLIAQKDNHPWLVEAQKHPELMKLIGCPVRSLFPYSACPLYMTILSEPCAINLIVPLCDARDLIKSSFQWKDNTMAQVL